MKKVIGFLLLVIITAHYSDAQIPYFQHYSLLRKNEPIQVNVIYQAQAGFMWFGTNKGLFKFDGQALRRFTIKEGLPDENVTAITQDSLGRLWIGHKNGNLSIVSNDSIKLFSPMEGTSSKEISDILFDKRGILWFSTLNDGLYYYKNNRVFRLDEQEGMPDLFIYDLCEDNHGNILAGTDGGMAICTLVDKKVSISVINYDHGLPDNIVKKIMVDKSDKIWIATEDEGIVIYDPSAKKVSSLINAAWNFGPITDFALDETAVWVSSKQTGLIVIDKTDSEKIRLYNSRSGADFMSVNTLTKDREGNIWIGSKSGVERARGNQVEFIETFAPVLDANILAVTVDRSGAIWFSNKEGLYRRDTNDEGLTTITKPLARTLHDKHTVISLFTDSTGFVWAGLYGEGALRIDPETNKINYFSKELRNGNVLNITGRGNDVWLATLGGATHIHFAKDKFIIKNYSSKDGLSSDYIYQVFIDHANRIWFATDGKGVNMLDENGFHYFGTGSNTGVVYGLAEDRNNRIWANVQNDGLYELKDNKFQASVNLPLRSKNINALSADRFGNLVIMHDYGIDLVDARKNNVSYLGNNVGMRDKTATLNALATDRYGAIFIGTDNGIIKYNPARLNDQQGPRPSIESLKILDKNVDLKSVLDFRYSQNNITINYRGFWYEDPENVSYEYILENYDRKWISSLDRSVVYSSLPPGEYIFKVRASHDGKFKEAKEATIRFTISPPFWRTIWFYCLAALAILTLGYLYIRHRERKLKRDKKILEAKVYERTLEIQKNSEEIQSQNEEIQSQAEEILGINENLEELVKQRTQELERKNKALEEYAFINAHELRAPVASILGLIDLISKTPLNDESKAIVNHMEGSAEKLNTIVRSITKAIERGV